MNSNALEIARIVLWDHYGRMGAAWRYCDKVASMRGESAAVYSEAADLIAQQAINGANQEAREETERILRGRS